VNPDIAVYFDPKDYFYVLLSAYTPLFDSMIHISHGSIKGRLWQVVTN